MIRKIEEAIYNNHNIEEIKQLLINNINIKDDIDETPLHYVCDYGNLELIKYLVNNGAIINCRNEFGETPLHLICRSYYDVDHLKIIKFLVKKGANINAIQHNNTLLFIVKDRFKIMKYFIKKGIDINHINTTRRTILDYLLNETPINEKTIKYLLKLNAKSNYVRYIDDLNTIKLLIRFDIANRYHLDNKLKDKLLNNRYYHIIKYMNFKEKNLRNIIKKLIM